jgi:hypothetical protein
VASIRRGGLLVHAHALRVEVRLADDHDTVVARGAHHLPIVTTIIYYAGKRCRKSPEAWQMKPPLVDPLDLAQRVGSTELIRYGGLQVDEVTCPTTSRADSGAGTGAAADDVPVAQAAAA